MHTAQLVYVDANTLRVTVPYTAILVLPLWYTDTTVKIAEITQTPSEGTVRIVAIAKSGVYFSSTDTASISYLVI
jgi:hypothetical protein